MNLAEHLGNASQNVVYWMYELRKRGIFISSQDLWGYGSVKIWKQFRNAYFSRSNKFHCYEY